MKLVAFICICCDYFLCCIVMKFHLFHYISLFIYFLNLFSNVPINKQPSKTHASRNENLCTQWTPILNWEVYDNATMTWATFVLNTKGVLTQPLVHVPTALVNGTMPFPGHHTGLFYSSVQVLYAGLCSLITLALLDGPFSFSSLSSVSPRLLRSSTLTLRSRWDTCQKATQPHRANNWARHTQFTAGGKRTWKHVIKSMLRKQGVLGQDTLCL